MNTYTIDEVEKHNLIDDAWVIIYMGRNAFDTERIVYD